MSGLEVRGLRVLGRGPYDFDVENGECISIEGPSGSGKSLLLRALVDLDPHEGSVALDGVACTDVRPERWRRDVGMLPAESAWWEDRVGPHFPAGADMSSLGFGPEVLTWEVRRLSSGERHRLALARLLAHRPKALLLDEPTASLDAVNMARVESVVTEFREARRAPVVWVSHDRAQVRRVASRHFALEPGGFREAPD